MMYPMPPPEGIGKLFIRALLDCGMLVGWVAGSIAARLTFRRKRRMSDKEPLEDEDYDKAKKRLTASRPSASLTVNAASLQELIDELSFRVVGPKGVLVVVYSESDSPQTYHAVVGNKPLCIGLTMELVKKMMKAIQDD